MILRVCYLDVTVNVTLEVGTVYEGILLWWYVQLSLVDCTAASVAVCLHGPTPVPSGQMSVGEKSLKVYPPYIDNCGEAQNTTRPLGNNWM